MGECLEFQTLATSSKHPRNTVGPAVRRHRVAHEWSQAEFAARCQLAGWDVSRGIVAAIEGRVRWVEDFEVVVLAHVLGTSMVSLYPEKIDWREFKDLSYFASGQAGSARLGNGRGGCKVNGRRGEGRGRPHRVRRASGCRRGLAGGRPSRRG
jgi:hypothetical protein